MGFRNREFINFLYYNYISLKNPIAFIVVTRALNDMKKAR